MHKKSFVRDFFIITNKMRRTLDKEHQKYGIYLSQARILKYIYQNSKDSIYQKDIEEAFSIRGASVTGNLDIMVKEGFLIRVESTKDKRRKKILLTDIGIDKAIEAINTIVNFEREFENALNEEEVKMLEEIMKKLNNWLDIKEQGN